MNTPIDHIELSLQNDYSKMIKSEIRLDDHSNILNWMITSIDHVGLLFKDDQVGQLG